MRFRAFLLIVAVLGVLGMLGLSATFASAQGDPTETPTPTPGFESTPWARPTPTPWDIEGTPSIVTVELAGEAGNVADNIIQMYNFANQQGIVDMIVFVGMGAFTLGLLVKVVRNRDE